MKKKILAVVGSLMILAVLLMAQFPTVRPSLVIMESNVDLKLDPRTPWAITVWEYITSGNPWWYWYGYDGGTASLKYGRVRVDALGKFVIEAEEEIIIASDLGMADDQLLTFGDDLDASIEYDEADDDLWKFGVPVSNDTLALLQRADVGEDLAAVPAYSNPTLALYGASFTDYLAFYHNETDAYFRTLDGSFILQTDEATNTATIVSLLGKGTQGSIFRMTDADDDFIFEIDNDTLDETAIFDAGGTDIIHYFATGSEYQDNIRLQFGNDDDASMEIDTSGGIFVLGIPTTASLGSSKGMVICDNDDVAFNHGGSIFTTGNVRVHFMDSDTDTWFYIGYADDDKPNLESIHETVHINYTADQDVNFFTTAASGETPEVKIFGYKAGDSLLSLEIGVGVDTADTASFDGLSNYWFDGSVRTTLGQFSGIWGDGNGVGLSDTYLSAGFIYGEIKSGTTITGGNVVRGTWERVLVNHAQPNQVTIVGVEAQIRVKSDLADGVHAGLWAYFEQSGTVVLSSPGQNAGISVTVEGSSGLTVDNGATLSGIVIDSSVHDDVTMNGNFDAIWIKVSGANEKWENDIRLQNDETITNFTDGTIAISGNLGLAANSITGTSVDINNSELQQLSAIGAVTIDVTQWGYLGASDQGFATGLSPTYVTAKFSGLTDGYIPYHVNDATGLADSVIFTDGTNVGIGVSPSEKFQVAGDIRIIDSGSDPTLLLGDATTAGTYGLIWWDSDVDILKLGTQAGGIDTVSITEGGRVGIGAVPTANMDGLSIELGLLTLKERATPTADNNYGKIYTKTDNNLYFQNGGGVERAIALADTFIAEMFMYESVGDITIDTTDEYHLMSGFGTGDVTGWTFDAGSTGPVASFATAGGNLINATDVNHGLVTGDEVSITGTSAPNDYNGVYTVTRITDDIFQFTKAGFNVTTTATWTEGAYLEAGADAAGEYLINWSITGASDVAATKNWKFEPFLNSSEINHAAAEMTPTSNKHQNCGATGFLTIITGDRIYLAVKNETDTTDLELEHGNVNLHRI